MKTPTTQLEGDKTLMFWEGLIEIFLLPILSPFIIICLAFAGLRWLYIKTTALSVENAIRMQRKYLRSCRHKTVVRIREDMHIFITAILLLALYGGIIWWLVNKPL